MNDLLAANDDPFQLDVQIVTEVPSPPHCWPTRTTAATPRRTATASRLSLPVPVKDPNVHRNRRPPQPSKFPCEERIVAAKAVCTGMSMPPRSASPRTRGEAAACRGRIGAMPQALTAGCGRRGSAPARPKPCGLPVLSSLPGSRRCALAGHSMPAAAGGRLWHWRGTCACSAAGNALWVSRGSPHCASTRLPRLYVRAHDHPGMDARPRSRSHRAARSRAPYAPEPACAGTQPGAGQGLRLAAERRRHASLPAEGVSSVREYSSSAAGRVASHRAGVVDGVGRQGDRRVPTASAWVPGRGVADLVDHGVLISSLRPPSTCADPLRHILEQLHTVQDDHLNELQPVAAALGSLHIDLGGIAAGMTHFELADRMRPVAILNRQPVAVDLRLADQYADLADLMLLSRSRALWACCDAS